MGIRAELKTDPQIVHQRFLRKGLKTRQNDEVQDQFLLIFRDFLTKTAIFMALRAWFWPGPSKW